MEIADFIYHRPTTVHQVCKLLSDLGQDADVLAGGTELLVDLKQHSLERRHLVSLRDLTQLREITLDDQGLHVGAMATLGGLAHSQTVRENFPALAEAASTMAAVQVRNRGTVGGNFCSAVPSADLPPICIAGAARIRLVRPDGERLVPAEEFFAGPRQALRARNEVLVEILLPPQAWATGTGARYHKFGLRGASALAVAGVAAWVQVEEKTVRACRIALGAVHSTPLLAREASGWVVGKTLSSDACQQAGELASRECSPIDDLRGSAAYRRDLVRVLTARALADAGHRTGP